MKKLIFLTVASVLFSVASFALTPIIGSASICLGGAVSAYDTTGGGTWSTSNTAIAIVDSVGTHSANIYGIMAGTAVISYTLGGVSVTETVTVSPLPPPITGSTSFCVGATVTFSDAMTGGTWSSDWEVPIGISSGIATGVFRSTDKITYTSAAGCQAILTVTVVGIPGDSVTGPSTVCAGSIITISDPTTGGTWSSSDLAVATVSSGGVVAGVAAGTTNITYSASASCGIVSEFMPVTVVSSISPGTISGASSVAIGANSTYYDGVSGGTWSSSNPAVGSIDPTTGILTGISTGSTTLSYAVSGCSGLVYATQAVTITSLNGISGHINFTVGSFYGYIKVWLITYNSLTSMLEAIDSTTISASGSSVYYQFTGEPTDSFRVKASGPGADTGHITGYLPTYHTSSFYWNTANVIGHVSGASDINEDINMGYGTLSVGPGFIGGSVLTGANKGTSGSIPAVGLAMYLINSSTGAVMQQTFTDASGNYYFSNLPVGASYYVHPEALNYISTDYTGITLTASAPRVTAASFIQHTVSLTITPIPEGVMNTTLAAAFVITYPNPTTGKLNIQWQEPTAEKATVTISDITGRELYKAAVSMNQGSGNSQVDLSALTNGLYMISVKSANINYNNKIQMQR